MTGFSSYPVVMRGLCGAFEALGFEVVRADLSGHGDVDPYVVKRLSLGQFPADGGLPKLVFAMKPSPQMVGLVEQGATLVGLHVGDVDQVPAEWRLIMDKEALVVVPSTWMQTIVEPATAAPVVVSNHGIEQEYIDHGPVPVLASTGPFRFLHFCSSGAYPERKGTPQLLEAFQKLRGPAELSLVVSEMRRPLKRLLGGLPRGIRDDVYVLTRPYGISTAGMIELYAQHHALVAPSRAEGFGLQPLEARALGIPVAQTLCTGFRDGIEVGQDPLSVGVVKIPHGPMVNAWGDFGAAPDVQVADIQAAMEIVIETYSALRAAARDAEMKQWSWVERTRELAHF